MDELGKDLDRTSFAGTGWREAPLFEAGLVVMSPAVGRAFEEAGVPDPDKPYGRSGVRPFGERHRRADWPGEAISSHRAGTGVAIRAVRPYDPRNAFAPARPRPSSVRPESLPPQEEGGGGPAR